MSPTIADAARALRSAEGPSPDSARVVDQLVQLAEHAVDDESARAALFKAAGEQLATLEPADAVRALTLLQHLVDPGIAADLRVTVDLGVRAVDRLTLLLSDTTGPDWGANDDTPRYMWEGLVAAFVDTVNSGECLVIDVDHHTARTVAWARLLELVRPIGEPTKYVGGFRKQLDRVASHATTLEGRDRHAAARVLVDRTAFGALTWPDFLHGIRTASALDPRLLVPSSAVQTVAWPCLPYCQEPPALAPAIHGLRVAFEVLCGAERPHLVGMQQRRLAVLLHSLTVDERDTVLDLAAGLHPDDLRTVQVLVHPELHRKRRFRRRG